MNLAQVPICDFLACLGQVLVELLLSPPRMATSFHPSDVSS